MTNAVLLCNVLYDRAPQLEDFAEGLDAKILRDAAETILLLRRLQREDRLVSPDLLDFAGVTVDEKLKLQSF